MNKIKIYNIASFIVAAGFVLLGFLFYDWSFHMVPYSSHTGKEWLDLFVVVCLILWGALLMCSTIMSYKKPSSAPSFFRVAFWLGLSAIFIGGAVVVIFSLKESFLKYYLQVVGTLVVFYVPMILLYSFKNFQVKYEK